MPKRVLFVANDPIGQAVTRYRCENFAEILRTAGCAVEVVYIGDSSVKVDHDVVVLHRICRVMEGRAYASAARACGAALVYGADDLVFDPAELSVGVVPTETVRRKLQKFAPLHAAMLREADAVLLSTAFLADRSRAVAGAAAKPAFVLRNFLSPTLLQLSATAFKTMEAAMKNGKQRPVTLAYLSGTPSHDRDLETIAGPLAAALTEFHDSELLLAGPVAESGAFAAARIAHRVRRHPFVPWRDLPNVLAGVDINLAPLDLTDPLTQGKSEIKLLEAAALRIPTIASPSAGFREALAAGPGGGFLAATSDDWRARLGELIGDRAARREAGEAAWEFVNAHGTAEANRAKVLDTFAEIHALPRPRPEKPRPTLVAGSALSPIRVKYWVKAALFRRVRGA